MDIRQLEAFVVTVRFKSFSKAADFLYLSQPTVSAHIRNLERELGGPLINRKAGEFKLTELGEIVYQKALNLLEARDEIYNAAEAQFQNKVINIAIAASTIPAEYLLPDIISGFISTDEKVYFKILERNSEDAIDMVRHDLCDIGVVGTRINYDDLEYERLVDDELVFIVSGSLVISPVIAINDLMHIPFVFREERSGTYITLRDSLRFAGTDISQLNNVMVMESNEGIKRIIEANGYMACLSSFCVKKELNEGRIKKVIVHGLKPHRSFYLTYIKDKRMTAVQKKFIDYMKNKTRTAPQ